MTSHRVRVHRADRASNPTSSSALTAANMKRLWISITDFFLSNVSTAVAEAAVHLTGPCNYSHASFSSWYSNSFGKSTREHWAKVARERTWWPQASVSKEHKQSAVTATAAVAATIITESSQSFIYILNFVCHGPLNHVFCFRIDDLVLPVSLFISSGLCLFGWSNRSE